VFSEARERTYPFQRLHAVFSADGPSAILPMKCLLVVVDDVSKFCAADSPCHRFRLRQGFGGQMIGTTRRSFSVGGSRPPPRASHRGGNNLAPLFAWQRKILCRPCVAQFAVTPFCNACRLH